MPARVETFTIEHSQPAERLDRFLARRFPGISRGAIQRLIQDGCIRVNGHAVKATHTPRAGELVEIEWPEPRPASVEPEAMPLEILFEDESLLVLNKPAGVVVHPSAGHEAHTLVHALLHHCGGRLSGIGGVARPGIVHRL
ncbi:MAG: S4 domain-containing protein, partial [Verrucomicrobiales bacterium]|nr:S4 domain-containing protein [Verrucomicrobiales bacterium]